MATRRIARGRGGSPVPIIILCVLLVGAIALAVVFAMQADKLRQEIEARKADVEAAEKSRRLAETKGQQYQTLMGINYDAMQEEFNKLKDELQKIALLQKADDGAAPRMDTVEDMMLAYAREVAALRTELADRQASLDRAKAESEQHRVDKEKAVTERDEGVKLAQGERDAARDERDTIQKKLDKDTRELNAKVAELEAEKVKLIKDVNHWKKRAEVEGKKVEDKDKQIDELKHPVDVRGSLAGDQAVGEPVDGKVITIEADGETCMIDLGRRDWVQIGMEFSVYDNADPESRKVKGHIQVKKVFDTIAQCRIGQQDKLDPVLPGMVIVNPAFQRGKTLNFVLVEPFREPNVEQLLARYPCKVKKVNPTDTEKLDRDTDYVVTGEGRIKEGVTRPDDSPTVEQAKQYQITVMRESVLLRYLGELD